MSNVEGSLNERMIKNRSRFFGHLGFVIISSFVIRHSSFPS